MIILYYNLPSGVVFINYPDGPCNFCLGNIYKILPQGATLTIVWTDPTSGNPKAVKITGGTDPNTGNSYPRVPVSPPPTPKTN